MRLVGADLAWHEIRCLKYTGDDVVEPHRPPCFTPTGLPAVWSEGVSNPRNTTGLGPMDSCPGIGHDARKH